MRGTDVILLAFGLALAGCAAQTLQGTPAPLAPSQMRRDVAAPAAWGITQVEVRAFASSGGVASEVNGASCDLASPYSTAKFVAPATISVPDFGPATPPLRINCTQGGQKGTLDVFPQLRATNGAAGWPAIGISVGTGGYSGVSVGGFWTGGMNTMGPAVQQAIYPDARIMMQ